MKILRGRFLFAGFVMVATCAQAEDLIISAAASQLESFSAIAKRFEAAHEGTHVVLNFAASAVLLRQIEQGAPVDDFARADEATMNLANAAHRIVAETRRDFSIPLCWRSPQKPRRRNQ